MSGGGPNIGNSKNTSLRNTPKGASGVNIVLVPKQQKRRTMGQILKSQLAETRQSLKTQIEAKLRLEKEVSQADQKLAKLTEGLQDILALANQQIAKQEEQFMKEEEQSDAGESQDKAENVELDSIIHTIISKFFKLQRSFDNRIMEFQHQLDVGRLQAEDAENVKFDFEILTEEKNLQDQEIEGLQSQIQQLKQRLADQHEKFSEEQNQQRKQTQEVHQRQLQEVHANYQNEQGRLVTQKQKEMNEQIDEIKQQHNKQA